MGKAAEVFLKDEEPVVVSGHVHANIDIEAASSAERLIETVELAGGGHDENLILIILLFLIHRVYLVEEGEHQLRIRFADYVNVFDPNNDETSSLRLDTLCR